MSLMGQVPDASASTPFSKDRLRDALDGIIVRRFFAGWNKIEQGRESRDPEIVVNGVGRIHLPLSEEQAQQIISKAHPASFDNGSSEAAADTAAQQNAWELDPQSFTITAQWRWDRMLKEFLAVISDTLGVSNRILRADLHKLSIWEKDAVFKAHADSENIPHMFGTLVISLPSHHQGGDIVVRYLDQEGTFSTCEYPMAGAYWCSEALHEVLPLEFGYGWVLTYNLTTTIPLKKPLDDTEIGDKLLRDAMQQWASLNSPYDTNPLYYALDNKYAEADLSPANLKLRDQTCLERALHVSHDMGFGVFLANLEREDIYEIDHEEEFYRLAFEEGEEDEEEDDMEPPTSGECINSTLRVESVYDLRGKKILSFIRVERDTIMHGDSFGGNPDSQEDDEKVTTHHWRLSALVIVPPKAMVPFLTLNDFGNDFGRFGYRTGSKPDIIDYCIHRCELLNNDSALNVLMQLLEKKGRPGQLDWANNTVLAERLYKLAMTHHGSELMNWITRHAPPLPLTVLGWSRRQFETFAISFERLNIGFSSVVRTRKSLSEQYQVILAFRADLGQKDKLLELMKDAPTKTICDNWGSSPSYDDGAALCNIALCAHDGLEMLKFSIIPKLVETYSQKTQFMFGFLHECNQGMQRKEIMLADSQPIYENLVRVTVRDMLITLLSIKDEEAHDNKRYRQTRSYTLPTIPLASYEVLYCFMASLFQPYLEEQRDIFIKKITAEAISIDATNFEKLWIPLLRNMLFNSEELKISLSDRSWQQFYQHFLESFLLIYVGSPHLKFDLVRKPVMCSCNDCRELNQFLLDPTMSIRPFRRVTFSQQAHFSEMLPANRKDCTNIGYPNYTIAKIEAPKIASERDSRGRRKLKAAKLLRAFDQEKLRTVLAEKYNAIMTMSFLEDTATINSSASSSMQRREPLAPLPTNLTTAITPLALPANNTPSSTQLRANNVKPPYGPPMAYMAPIQPMNSSATKTQARTPGSAQTTISGRRRLDLSWITSTQAMRDWLSSAPSTPTRQGVGNSSVVLPSTATRSVSNPSRPLPTTMIRHPVAGAKRKMVELIDLTAEDDSMILGAINEHCK